MRIPLGLQAYLYLTAIVSISQLSGCSIASINAQIKPANDWVEQEYEQTRFTQRYKFTKSDIEDVRAAVATVMRQLGATVLSQTDNEITMAADPLKMFSAAECESWVKADNDKSKELSGGLLSLTCDPSKAGGTIIVATFSLKRFKHGTLIVLDYEFKLPAYEAYGLQGPRRPFPTASKDGSAKIWALVSRTLPYPIRDATKNDLQ